MTTRVRSQKWPQEWKETDEFRFFFNCWTHEKNIVGTNAKKTWSSMAQKIFFFHNSEKNIKHTIFRYTAQRAQLCGAPLSSGPTLSDERGPQFQGPRYAAHYYLVSEKWPREWKETDEFRFFFIFKKTRKTYIVIKHANRFWVWYTGPGWKTGSLYIQQRATRFCDWDGVLGAKTGSPYVPNGLPGFARVPRLLFRRFHLNGTFVQAAKNRITFVVIVMLASQFFCLFLCHLCDLPDSFIRQRQNGFRPMPEVKWTRSFSEQMQNGSRTKKANPTPPI